MMFKGHNTQVLANDQNENKLVKILELITFHCKTDPNPFPALILTVNAHIYGSSVSTVIKININEFTFCYESSIIPFDNDQVYIPSIVNDFRCNWISRTIIYDRRCSSISKWTLFVQVWNWTLFWIDLDKFVQKYHFFSYFSHSCLCL